MFARGRSTVAVVITAAVLGWPSAASAAARGVAGDAAPDRPAEQLSNGAACATEGSRPYVRTTSPVLAVRQSDPNAGQAELTTTFAWWPIGGTTSGAGRATKSAGNPSAVTATIPAGLLADGGTYAWRARTFDGTRFGPWSARCEFTVDVTAPEPSAGISSTGYPADGQAHEGPGIPGDFVISPPLQRPEDVVAYAWTDDSGVSPASAELIPADTAHGATLTYTPARDGIITLRVWSKDRAGWFSTPVTWTFFVKAVPVPQPARPATPTISFPGGNSADQGGTLAMRLDANGDNSVTQFRYSLRSTGLDLTAVPDRPGGSVIVQIPVGNGTGPWNVYAVASDGTTDSLITVGSFEVRSVRSLSGWVRDVATGSPVEGATVRAEPGGHVTTTSATGDYSFSTTELPPGDYTISVTYGDKSSGEQILSVDRWGVVMNFYLFPPEGDDGGGWEE